MHQVEMSQFDKFNEGMKVSYLTRFARFIECHWQDEETRRRNLSYFRKLISLSKQRPTIQLPELTDNMSRSHFISAQLQMEKQLGTAAQDQDFLVSQFDRKQVETDRHTLVLVLENLRSAFNVGSIFRSADGLGVGKIIVCGYTPTPDHPKVRETALGAESAVEWEHASSIEHALSKVDGYEPVAVETIVDGPSLYDEKLPKKCAFLFGNEREGLTSNALSAANRKVTLPLSGIKNSLNVAVCMSICGYEYNRQFRRELNA